MLNIYMFFPATEMEEGTQWKDAQSEHEEGPMENSETSSKSGPQNTEVTTDFACDSVSKFGIPGPTELMLMLGVGKSDDMMPYPSLAVTRNTSQQLVKTKQLLGRFYKQLDEQDNVEDMPFDSSENVRENVVDLSNGNTVKPDVINPHFAETQSLPSRPSYATNDVIKYGRKGYISKKRSERIHLSEKAQPKMGEGFWHMKGGFKSAKPPVQDRLPPRSKSHIGFPRGSPVHRKRDLLPDRPHTVSADASMYTTKMDFRNRPEIRNDPDMIHPRLLVDVLEAENVSVNAKDIYHASGWRDYKEQKDHNKLISSEDLRINIDGSMHDISRIQLKRSLRPKHGTQRLKMQNHAKQNGVEASHDRHVTSTPNAPRLQAKNKLYSEIMLTINNDKANERRSNGISNEKPTQTPRTPQKLPVTPRSNQVRKGHCLKSPRVDMSPSKQDGNSVVPIPLHPKDFKSLLLSRQHGNSSMPDKHQHDGYHTKQGISQTDNPKNIRWKTEHKSHSRSTHKTRDQQFPANANNDYHMDISIKKRARKPTDTHNSRRIPESLIQKFGHLIAVPSNTPVISRSSSQDWLEQSVDHFDCSYD